MTSSTDELVRPFEVSVDASTIDDLRRRLADSRWPDQLPNSGWKYGTDRETLQSICEYWRREFNWDAFEQRCNRFDQSVTIIDGQQVHFYHAHSEDPSAQPLLLMHGWPGSVAEFLDVLGPLSDPTAHGGTATDAFHVVAPSIPGYGFSGPTDRTGVDIKAVTEVVAELMERLGYDRYFVQGGDWGSLIGARIGADYPDRVLAFHTTMLFVSPSQFEDPMGMLDEDGMADYRETTTFRDGEMGYYEIQSTKPQTLAYGLTDSPVGLAGWLVEKFQRWTDSRDGLLGSVSTDRLLDNVTIYWLTGTINASMRLYYETDAKATIPTAVDVPTGHARYPAEITKTPRAWAEVVYNIVYWSEMEAGGHFPAMEQPESFVADLRTFFEQFR